MNNKLLIIIPCYNEEKNIGGLIDNIKNVSKNYDLETDVLCVNDCSPDDTLAVIKKRRYFF